MAACHVRSDRRDAGEGRHVVNEVASISQRHQNRFRDESIARVIEVYAVVSSPGGFSYRLSRKECGDPARGPLIPQWSLGATVAVVALARSQGFSSSLVSIVFNQKPG